MKIRIFNETEKNEQEIFLKLISRDSFVQLIEVNPDGTPIGLGCILAIDSKGIKMWSGYTGALPHG